MNTNKSLFLLFVVLTSCYHNPFLIDSYEEPSALVENGNYITEHYWQKKDLQTYELQETEECNATVGKNVQAQPKAYEGFDCDSSNVLAITEGQVTKDGNLVLKLYYNRKTCVVTFDKNADDANGTMEAQTFTYGVAQELTQNAFSRAGCTFTGWAKTASATEKEFVDKGDGAGLAVEAAVTLYAVWAEGEPVSYTVEHYYQSVDLLSYVIDDEKTDSLESVAGQNVTAVEKTKEGFTCDSGNTSAVPEGQVTEDGSLVLKLYYKRNTYTVIFDKNDAAAEGTMENQTFTYGVSKALTKNTFTWTGHTFTGWAKSKSATGEKIADEYNEANLTSGTNDITLYAVWELNTYTVTFNKNDAAADGTMDNQTFTYGVSQALTQNKFTCTGKLFAGWAQTDTGSKEYDDKADYTIGTENITLYAVWVDAPVITLTGKITGGEEFASGDPLTTTRSVTVSVSAENASCFYYSLNDAEDMTGDLTAGTGSILLNGLDDKEYSLSVYGMTDDGLKGEPVVLSWTIDAGVTLELTNKPASVIKRSDTPAKISVSGKNLTSCTWKLSGGTERSGSLANAGTFDVPVDATGDYTLVVTGKNELEESCSEKVSWKVVNTPVAELNFAGGALEATSKDITVSGSDVAYYKYKLSCGDTVITDYQATAIDVGTVISLTNLEKGKYYTLDVRGGSQSDESDVYWQSAENTTKISFFVFNGFPTSWSSYELSNIGTSYKSMYLTCDDDFIYVKYYGKNNDASAEGLTNKYFCFGLCNPDAGQDAGIQLLDKGGSHGFEFQEDVRFGCKMNYFFRIKITSSGTDSVWNTTTDGVWGARAVCDTLIYVESPEAGVCMVAIPRALIGSPQTNICFNGFFMAYSSENVCYNIYATTPACDNPEKANEAYCRYFRKYYRLTLSSKGLTLITTN